MPILDWLFGQHVPVGTTVDGRLADLSGLPRLVSGLASKVEGALALFPGDVLLVHRDSDARDPEPRYAEIAAAWHAQASVGHTRCVPLVPVRMTEAWLLFDRQAIRRAAGNPSGNVALAVPTLAECERTADPKHRLFDLLHAASELTGRKRRQFDHHAARSRITDFVADFRPLRRLASFQRFELDLSRAIGECLGERARQLGPDRPTCGPRPSPRYDRRMPPATTHPAPADESARAAPADPAPPVDLRTLPWAERLAFVVESMRDLSRQTDPQAMVRTYGDRMRVAMPADGTMSLSRRGLGGRRFRITRSSRFAADVDPWKQPHALPLLDGGLLGDLIYRGEATILHDLEVPADDPAAEYLAGHRSLLAIPLFDGGDGLNMVVRLRKDPAAFDPEGLPESVWMANLFGRATTTLLLAQQVREAYDALDREMAAVADIQRSLLPAQLPDVPGLDLAAHYQTSKHAGGDYYDFFQLPGGQWGMLVADVSGHGTPAAVLMAITHSIAHTCGDPKHPPGNLLAFVNERLTAAYTGGNGNFVTAFYAIWDPATRELDFANAGHPSPRVRRADGTVEPLDGDNGLPLGILGGEAFPNRRRPARVRGRAGAVHRRHHRGP